VFQDAWRARPRAVPGELLAQVALFPLGIDREERLRGRRILGRSIPPRRRRGRGQRVEAGPLDRLDHEAAAAEGHGVASVPGRGGQRDQRQEVTVPADERAQEAHGG
jgi:hypothetical protein